MGAIPEQASMLWLWTLRPFAIPKKFTRADEFSSQAVVLAVLLAGTALVFWEQLVGSAVFVGESDRLNTYLNMRLAEYDALRTFGRVPAWNATMFGGFSVAALHWMNPGTDPIAYILQLLPRDRLYQALGYLSIALVLAACTTAYLYIRDLIGARMPAAVGALCYALSIFGVHRIAQVDNAYLTLILLPAAMLAIRRVRAENLIRPFIGLALSMTALAFWGFLQEVAYAFCFLAAYALYRAAVFSKNGARAGLAVLIVFGAGSVVALLFAAPRLITVGSEFFQLVRTSAHFHHPGYQEFLRFFHEGIFGRYFSESRLVFNSLNLSEGLQLVSSTTVALFVCFGVLRPTTRLELVAGLLLFAMILTIRPLYHLPAAASGPLHEVINQRREYDRLNSASWPSRELISIGLFFCVLSIIALLLRKRGRYLRFGGDLTKRVPPPRDKAFQLFAFTMVLFLILVPEAYYTVYLMFGRSDFSHTRLSILALLPLCSLFAIYLAELKTLPTYPAIARPEFVRAVAIALGTALVAALLSWVIHGPAFDQLVRNTAFQVSPPDVILPHPPDLIVQPIAMKVVLTTIILVAVLAGIFWKPRRRTFDGRIVATIVVATFAFVETVAYAHFKVDGSHTWSYPVPFGGTSNYMNVLPSVMQPPGKDKLKAFAEKLNVEDFRSVLLTSPSFYPGAITSHISQFWRARMVGGYAGGVPKRLAELPWPSGVVTLRMIELRSMSDINPFLLSLLNVKYLVVTTPDLYFDTQSENSDKSILTFGGTAYPGEVVNINGISFGLIRNSVAPLPRHFLVEKITGVLETPSMHGAALEARAYPASESQDGARASALTRESIDQLTSHSLAEDFRGTQTFDTSGPLNVSYHADVIDVRVTPSNRDRFVVFNERYHPDWRASAQTGDIPIFPTNAIMMGIRIPANLNRIELRFEPFSSTRAAHMVMLLALLIFLAVVGVFWFAEGRLRRQTSMIRRPRTADRPAINGA
jgi:hypothetical protein